MKDFLELADWDEGLMHLTVGPHARILLNTMHGQVMIDVRANDVNAFVFENGVRRDIQLLSQSTPIVLPVKS